MQLITAATEKQSPKLQFSAILIKGPHVSVAVSQIHCLQFNASSPKYKATLRENLQISSRNAGVAKDQSERWEAAEYSSKKTELLLLVNAHLQVSTKNYRLLILERSLGNTRNTT